MHHNKYFRADRASLKSAMAEAHAKSPHDPDVAVVPIFKFERDNVIELWDLGLL